MKEPQEPKLPHKECQQCSVHVKYKTAKKILDTMLNEQEPADEFEEFIKNHVPLFCVDCKQKRLTENCKRCAELYEHKRAYTAGQKSVTEKALAMEDKWRAESFEAGRAEAQAEIDRLKEQLALAEAQSKTICDLSPSGEHCVDCRHYQIVIERDRLKAQLETNRELTSKYLHRLAILQKKVKALATGKIAPTNPYGNSSLCYTDKRNVHDDCVKQYMKLLSALLED